MISWLNDAIPSPSQSHLSRAQERQEQLTKPPGSLGRLESVAVRLASLLGEDRPTLERVRIVVFAADHGIAAAGISAFPQSVTVEMIKNFSRGGAAISVLAAELGAELEVVDVGAATDPGPLPGVISARCGAGTEDFRTAPAMTPEALQEALEAGRAAVHRARDAAVRFLIGGEMGIGNTTAAATLGAALTGASPTLLAGPGTGLDQLGVSHKAEVIQTALNHHGEALERPMEALRRVGGFEIAALTGFYLAAAQAGIPVLVDGFIATSAALAATRMREETAAWLFFGHRSLEPGHAVLLGAMNALPLLSLEMRLGEGSGAAVAIPVMRMACALHNRMATFQEAAVSRG
ncbi:MAG: nicotinate-nucleotide--dimethylbenzimidazole phosphoribosyltransferase [Magnetococcales bacterium]|nr:nicotinate-nucleotide--dimethylbenzimidazole phosphoribosyltransferase [Magnetococcales bacterium]